MRLALGLVLIGLLTTSAVAQGTAVGSSYLKFPITARAAALGESAVADRYHFSSFLVNPASFHAESGTDILLGHSSWIQEVSTELLGVRFPLFGTTLGFSIASSRVQGIEIRTHPGEPLGSFSAQFAAMGFSFAAPLSPEVIVGVSGKYLYEKIYVDETTGYTTDFGMIYLTRIPGIVVGASLTNVGSVSAYRTLRGDLPSRLQLGASYETSFGDFVLTFYPAYISNLEDITSYMNFGLEVGYRQYLFARSGYHGGSDARGFSAGLGVIYKSVGVDYAFVPFKFGLGDAHLATIRITL